VVCALRALIVCYVYDFLCTSKESYGGWGLCVSGRRGVGGGVVCVWALIRRSTANSNSHYNLHYAVPSIKTNLNYFGNFRDESCRPTLPPHYALILRRNCEAVRQGTWEYRALYCERPRCKIMFMFICLVRLYPTDESPLPQYSHWVLRPHLRDRVVGTPASFSEGPWFRSRVWD
jgi:hypothetical protein